MENGIKILPYLSLNLNAPPPRKDYSVFYKVTKRAFLVFFLLLQA